MPSLTTSPEAALLPSPFEAVAPHCRATRQTKGELLAASRRLERKVLERADGDCVVLVTFQHKEHLTPATRDAYAALARSGARVYAFARGLVSDYRTESWELNTVSLVSADPLVSEWDIVVLGPRIAHAFVARDLDPGRPVSGADLDRPFSHTSSDDRALVEAAADALLARVPARHR